MALKLQFSNKILKYGYWYSSGVDILPYTRPKRTGRKLTELQIQEGNKPRKKIGIG